MKDLLETWEINNRINLYLLEGIDEQHLEDTLTSKGRNAGQQFAHIHNVRLMWLKASAPDLLKGMDKLENVSKQAIAYSLEKSGDATKALLDRGFREGKIKGFKPHPSAFLGYLISHESHHRGQIILALKQSGHSIDRKIQLGIWEWGSR